MQIKLTRKIFFLSLMVSLVTNVSNAQYDTSKINWLDTVIVVGVLKEDCFFGKSISGDCSMYSEKPFKQGKTVIIGGARKCKASFTEKKFYEVYCDGGRFLVESYHIRTLGDPFKDILSRSKSKADSFRLNGIHYADVLTSAEKSMALKKFDDINAKGLVIIDWNIYDQSEYTDGTGVKIEIYNPSSKTIKYLWFTFVGINPVGDKVVDYKHKTSSITMKAVGPNAKEESGIYDFEYVWFTGLVETARVKSIKIQYMDGSFKTIDNPNKIMLDKETFSSIFTD